MDTRAKQTRFALAQALIRLAPARGYEAISVDELTREAEVGRSTFYGHYSSKDDFLDRSFSDMLWSMNKDAWATPPASLLPVLKLFEHMLEARAFATSMLESGEFDALIGRREETLIAIAEANLANPSLNFAAERKREAAIMLAGALGSLVRWWAKGGMKVPPSEMQAWFDRFAGATLSAGRVGAAPGAANA